MKKKPYHILILLAVVLAVAGVMVYSNSSDNITCKEMKVEVVDSARYGFIDDKNVATYLDNQHLNPLGLSIKNIDLQKMEASLCKHPFVKDAQCYKSLSGDINVEVKQRRPLVRVKAKGSDYYVDTDGKMMRTSQAFAADVMIVSGDRALPLEFIEKNLLEMVRYVNADKFWSAMVEQFYVEENGTIEMIPRVGSHIVIIGEQKDYKSKLRKLKKLYVDGFSKTGWSEYSKVDLRYKGQIVCTRR